MVEQKKSGTVSYSKTLYAITKSNLYGSNGYHVLIAKPIPIFKVKTV